MYLGRPQSQKISHSLPPSLPHQELGLQSLAGKQSQNISSLLLLGVVSYQPTSVYQTHGTLTEEHITKIRFNHKIFNPPFHTHTLVTLNPEFTTNNSLLQTHTHNYETFPYF